MVNTRRGFLGMLGAVIAGATLDPEFALWVPGKKLISIPKPYIQVFPPNAYEIITRSLVLIGEIHPNGAISADDYNLGVHVLNEILDQRGGEKHAQYMIFNLANRLMPYYGLSRAPLRSFA